MLIVAVCQRVKVLASDIVAVIHISGFFQPFRPSDVTMTSLGGRFDRYSIPYGLELGLWLVPWFRKSQ